MKLFLTELCLGSMLLSSISFFYDFFDTTQEQHKQVPVNKTNRRLVSIFDVGSNQFTPNFIHLI